uniref:Roc domain-containing protein n=1 Tax=Guillardia theta TaxID=55529 RepID=A0A7S4JL51_GUITH|mmetsp:Transcript_17270/g.57153  ORF Transcript_17270/g.57153 Transcript_17270/m.57153 type:complete len:326 (+) Transcript_17270:227-1204(+)
MCQHCKDRRSCVHNLEQDLVSSRPSRQDAIAKIEKVREHVNNVGKPFAQRLDLVKCHYIFGMQEIDTSAVEDVKQLLSGGELGSCYNSEEGTLNMSLRTDRMKRYVIRDLRMKSLPRWISELGVAFKVIDVSGNPSLSRLPLDELCSMESSLQEVKCESCVSLQLPPPEIASQGGAAAFTYLQSVKRDSEANKRINLILIGNGEAGKTSVLRALRSDKDKADKIEVDRRTIGIDLHEWEPKDADGLTFDVMDFGGQQIYAKTNQYFIVRRALYLLVWSVRAKRDKESNEDGGEGMEELKKMIPTWLRATQARVPDSTSMCCCGGR